MTGRLVIVGSGETSPTMVKIHRQLMAGLSPAIMLDTPYGFQVNADDLTVKIGEYFHESVGRDLEVARWRNRDEPITDRERALALLARAGWAFAGPGSPSYALRQWQDTPVPTALRDIAARGGTVVLGSAAAVTTGRYAIPVYEIYKVGIEPHWLDGLDLLGSLFGISAAVIPHYDNREGGRHDTRYCYLGEQRLELLEGDLPDDAGVLGVDEHTAVVLDMSTGQAEVLGTGGLTLRYRQNSTVIPSGSTISVDDIASAITGSGSGHASPRASAPSRADEPGTPTAPTSLRAETDRLSGRFDAGIASGDADAALAAALDLEAAIQEWSADTLQGDDIDYARAALRAMLVTLAGAAVEGLRDTGETIGPFIEIALDIRQRARAAKDFELSDLVRDRLAGLGIEVRDTPDGPAWQSLG